MEGQNERREKGWRRETRTKNEKITNSDPKERVHTMSSYARGKVKENIIRKKKILKRKTQILGGKTSHVQDSTSC